MQLISKRGNEAVKVAQAQAHFLLAPRTCIKKIIRSEMKTEDALKTFRSLHRNKKCFFARRNKKLFSSKSIIKASERVREGKLLL
jgi:hypothetical protein